MDNAFTKNSEKKNSWCKEPRQSTVHAKKKYTSLRECWNRETLRSTEAEAFWGLTTWPQTWAFLEEMGSSVTTGKTRDQICNAESKLCAAGRVVHGQCKHLTCICFLLTVTPKVDPIVLHKHNRSFFYFPR